MQNWSDLYLELANKLKEETNVRWIDLWHNQINFLEEEHPFPAPAIFLSFRALATQDMGLKIQKVPLQVDVYYFYETFADTNMGAINQSDAMEFLKGLTAIHQSLHGTEGDNYSSMRRVGFAPVDTGSAQNLYVQNFTCELIDQSAQEGRCVIDAEDLDIEGSIKNNPFIVES
jgi:hypothetical protein